MTQDTRLEAIAGQPTGIATEPDSLMGRCFVFVGLDERPITSNQVVMRAVGGSTFDRYISSASQGFVALGFPDAASYFSDGKVIVVVDYGTEAQMLVGRNIGNTARFGAPMRAVGYSHPLSDHQVSRVIQALSLSLSLSLSRRVCGPRDRRSCWELAA